MRWNGKDPHLHEVVPCYSLLEEGMAIPSSILAGESHGQRSLAGYSPWGYKESNTAERLTHAIPSIQNTSFLMVT